MRGIIRILIMMLLSTGCYAATVSGFITNADSGEPLQYVNVRVSGTKIGTQTNKKGYYVVTLDKTGDYQLLASLVGYRSDPVPFNLKDTDGAVTLNVAMYKSAVELQKTVVYGTAIGEYTGPDIPTSLISQTNQDIQMVVSPVEADVFRAVLALPGVAPISDFSAGLYVRGGSPDQNLILLDDIDVYNPNHFGGIFSTFNSDAVESVDLIKGGFPALYGGRMSSVLDVLNRQGNRMHHQGVARLSLISSSATLEGPLSIGGQKGSYMASFRRTYIDLIKKFYEELPDYYFYDGNVKVNWDLDERNKFNLSAYFGRDDLSFDFGSVLDLDWGNRTFTGQWVHLFNPSLFSQFIIAGSEFSSHFDQINALGEKTFRRVNGIQDFTGKGTLSWKPNNNHQLDTGYEIKWNDTWLKVSTTYQYEQNALPDVDVKSLTSAAFVQDIWDIDEFWTFQPGLRLAWYRTLALKPVHIPKASNFNVEPRLAIRRKLDVGESVYANFGVYNQYLTLMSMDVSTPFDVWFPLDGSLEPGRSLHYILGYERNLNPNFGFDGEIYYKTYQNLLQYDSTTDFTWDNETGTLSDTFHVGKGYTYGADLMLRNDWNNIEGYIGYTYSQTRRKMEGLNVDPETGEPRYFYPRYDRSHSLNLVQTYNLSENTGFQILGSDVKLGINLAFTSGQPESYPERIYFDGENFQLIYSYQDRKRLPAYIRFDLSTKYEWTTRWGSIEPYFEIINLFNRKNIGSRSYRVVINDDGTTYLRERDGTQFPFLPFLGLNVKW